MAKSPKMLLPEPFVTKAFTDASKAVTRLEEIYARNTEFLRTHFKTYLNGPLPVARVRATYPLVRVTTATHSRLDSRLSYGFVSGPKAGGITMINIGSGPSNARTIPVCHAAGFHQLNHGMFELARGYADRGMAAYSELQQAEFDSEANGYTATRHQREVGTGYFDMVSNLVSGGTSSTTAMGDSTEAAQFNEDDAKQESEST